MKKHAHTPTRPHARKALILILFAFSSIFLTAQNNKFCYIEIDNNANIGTIHEIVNSDETKTFTLTNKSFETFLNSMQVYEFKKAFPTAVTPRLKRLYLIEIDSNQVTTDFTQRPEITYVNEFDNSYALAEEDPPIYSNDYIEIILDNLPNTVLEMTKAPLAWTIEKGDPNVLVGVSDGPVNPQHEDLQGKIAFEYNLSSGPVSHGTAVASLIVATNDNGIGMASLAGWNTNLVFANTNGGMHDLMEGVLLVSQHPGVKVVNASFGNKHYNSDHNEIFEEIAANGVLVVASAHNESTTDYYYPASYDSTLSVTTVGSRYPIGHIHDLGFDVMWGYSWKDCHEQRPDGIPSTDTNVHNDKVDVCAPNMFIMSAWNDYVNYPSGYRAIINTSSAAPVVSALAALIYSINPNFTAQQVKDIIKNTADDIYHIPYNQQYIGQLGTGRINAFRAVKTADCIVNPTPGLDLAMQNSNLDDFVEPDVNTEILWNSEDIWVRNQDDGTLIDVHENPEYDPNGPNYVYVRVTNNSCVTSSGTDNLKLYWAKASTSLYWPDHWNGTLYMPDPTNPNPVLVGDQIGTLTIPTLGPGESKILEFPWIVPNPQDYVGINSNPWHFCLLARIESVDDPMTYPEGIIITNNVKNNNNIAWKNTTIVDIFPNVPSQIGGVIAVGNPFSTTKTFNLQFAKDGNETGPAIYNEAEVSIEMDDVFYDAWVRGGKQGQNFTSSGLATKKRIATGNNMEFNNIIFEPNEIGTVNVKFNFLTSQVSAKKDFVYHAIQRDAVTNQVIGGESYEIHKRPRPVFGADAGNDETIDRSESVTISASQINEAAVYNWYDPDGNLIYTGTDLTVSPEVTKTYKLEIITDIDGYKDYDEVEVNVNPYKLESLVPNPATSQVTVNYIADEANSAYLMVVSIVTGISNNYILDVNETSINLNVSGYSSGLYSVALVCDGEIVDSKNLAKQ